MERPWSMYCSFSCTHTPCMPLCPARVQSDDGHVSGDESEDYDEEGELEVVQVSTATYAMPCTPLSYACLGGHPTCLCKWVRRITQF